MKLKRKKIGDRSYNLIDTETGIVVAHAAQTGEHGRDNYPWEWSMNDGRIFGKLDYDTGRSVESLRDAVDAVESGATAYGILAPAGKIDCHTIKEGQVFRHKRYLYRATQDAYYSGTEEATVAANNYKGELEEVWFGFNDEVTLYLPEREARRAKALAEAKAEKAESALAAMVRKLDERTAGRGYVGRRDELIAILQEVSPLVTFVVLDDGGRNGDIAVEIKLTLTLSREDL